MDIEGFRFQNTEIADLLRKHGGKTKEALKAEGKLSFRKPSSTAVMS